ncbi:MAG TPA: spore coat protein, partial [Firmicutes bacterium]|nr:spore coat protein [Bacillota bacterium]
RIEEKPEHPKTNYAVIGIYMYDNRVFDIIRTLKPSARGELEITDVNNKYVEWGEMTYEFLEGWWADAGESIDYYLKANNLVAKYGANKMEL